MEAELEFHIDIAKQLENRAQQYALDHIIPQLSKAVIAKGEADKDHRTLLMLCTRTADYKYETTDEFRTWVSLFNDFSAEARAQIHEINNAGYFYYENISMMLEACDYFKSDTFGLIRLGQLYVQGRFNPTLRRW